MRAITASQDGPVLSVVAEPEPGPGQILVSVRAAALNRIDLRMSRGYVHGSSGGIGTPIGMEFTGEIVGLGAGVDTWTIGDRVMGMAPHAFAELTVASADAVLAVPSGLSDRQATTLPSGIQTMHDALVTRGAFVPGGSVLIQGASSGMGLMGMQIARELGASLVVGTSTSPRRRARLHEFGADLALDPRSDDWVEQVLSATDGQGVDVLLDLVGGPSVSDGMRALRIGGRMVNIGRVGGETSEVDLDLHSMRRITYIGTTFRTRTAEEIGEVIATARKALGAALREGRLTMPVEHVFPLEEALPAFELMEQNHHFGKIVIEVKVA